MEPIDTNTCAVNDDSLYRIIQHIVALSADFTLGTAPSELRRQLNTVAERLARAARDSKTVR